ncbi:hypothetical protein EHYA_03836 [Embleya hyalina]|uniref:Uncharacterized protein n=1 Tax=Embleya hyalina TaxID=516124 RepID=A0A401YNG3_9ACTN|nr:hypothetical protein EHYA_03836 [Embleya hyalina]
MPPAPTPSTPALGAGRWNVFPAAGTTLTARDFFAATEPLLQGIIDDNALTGADGKVLEDQVRATLALGTRETSLPLGIGPDSASAARELGGQAETIGRELASWAASALERLLISRIPLPAGPLVVRSHCYGHLLTPPAADLLRGRRGGPVTMQLYNEWLHQMVLLRDALLPFTNWQDVPLLITPTGLRHTEPARDAFLTELLVRRIRHAAIVDFARRVVTGTSGPAGYGFEAGGGTALPAVLDRPPLTAPRHLLTWRTDPAAEDTVTYVAEVQDYYAAPAPSSRICRPPSPRRGRSPPASAPGRSATGPAPPASRSPTTAPPPMSTSARPCAATASPTGRTPPRTTHPPTPRLAPRPCGPHCAHRGWCGRKQATPPWTRGAGTTSSYWPCSVGSTRRTSSCAPPAVSPHGQPRTAPDPAAW